MRLGANDRLFHIFAETLRFKNDELFEFWVRNNKNLTNLILYNIKYEIESDLCKSICITKEKFSLFSKEISDKHGFALVATEIRLLEKNIYLS